MIRKTVLIFIFVLSYFTVFSNNNLDRENFYTTSAFFGPSLTEITVCVDETLELTAEPVNNANYVWLTPDNETVNNIDLVRTNVTLNMAGQYSLTVTVNGCSNISHISVIVVPKPDAGSNGTIEVIEGIGPTESELFNTLGGNPDKGGTWTKKDNVYNYTVTSKASCHDPVSSTVTIVRSRKIVNGFSPNGDNINDVWEVLPRLLEKYPNNSLKVFNRIGDKIYEASPYKNDWDAIPNQKAVLNNTKRLMPGPYFFVLELNNPEKTFFKGWVYINY